MALVNGSPQEYKGSFNLASAAGQLISTIGTMNPARGYMAGPMALSPRRALRGVTITAVSAITQTAKVSIVDQGGTARLLASLDLVAATDFYFEPEHDIVIGPGENFQVDLTATGAPAVTGTITIFTDEI